MLLVHNASDVALEIIPVDHVAFTLPPRGRRSLVLGSTESGCQPWHVRARTEDGLGVARSRAPVCAGDEWVITQDDVDEALARHERMTGG